MRVRMASRRDLKIFKNDWGFLSVVSSSCIDKRSRLNFLLFTSAIRWNTCWHSFKWPFDISHRPEFGKYLQEKQKLFWHVHVASLKSVSWRIFNPAKHFRVLTLSSICTHFNTLNKKALLKPCGKMWNCSKWAISPLFTISSIQPVSLIPLTATFQLLSAAFLNFGRSRNGVLENRLTFILHVQTIINLLWISSSSIRIMPSSILWPQGPYSPNFHKNVLSSVLQIFLYWTKVKTLHIYPNSKIALVLFTYIYCLDTTLDWALVLIHLKTTCSVSCK